MAFSVVVAEATRNLCLCPSLETGTTGWAVAGATPGAIAQSATRAYRGRYALRVTPDATDSNGAKYTLTGLTIGVEYTATIYVYANSGIPMQVQITTTAAALIESLSFTGSAAWVRLTRPFTATATSHDIRVYRASGGSVAVFYVDALQVEAGGHATDYVDGDQVDCWWLGTAHGSASERSGQSRAGGREWTFAALGWSEASWSGLGLPPLRHTAEADLANGGGRYQGTVPKERAIILTLWAKATDVAALHDARKLLTDALGPKVLARDQPFLLRCDLTGEQLEIACVYDDGLGPTLDKGFQQTIQLRLLAFEPRWRSLKDTAVTLDAADGATMRHIAARSGVAAGLTGPWDSLSLTANPSGPATPIVYAIVEGPDGCEYIGGDFTSWNALGANYKGVVKWDPVARTYSALGTGITGAVECLMFDASGVLWVGGGFANAGGVAAADLIATWDGTVWNSPGGLAAPAGTEVRAIAQGHDGYVYATGTFTALGGTAAANIARYDLSTPAWSALGAGLTGGTNTGADLVVGPDGTVYVTGDFTAAGGTTALNIAKYTAMATTPAWSALGAGLNAAGSALAITRDGTLYAGGYFTTAGGVTVNYIARYNGRSWSALGGGANTGGIVTALAVDPTTNDLYAVGAFSTMGGIPMADGLGRWNGKAWVHVDIDLPGTLPTNYPRGVYVTRRGILFLGFDSTGACRSAGMVTAAIAGDTEIFPQIVITRSGGTGAYTLEMLKNDTEGNGLEVPMRLPMQIGETVVIDLRRPVPSIRTSLRGDVTAVAVREGGNFDSWSLRKGTNYVSLFVNGSGTATYIESYMTYRERYLAIDGSA